MTSDFKNTIPCVLETNASDTALRRQSSRSHFIPALSADFSDILWDPSRLKDRPSRWTEIKIGEGNHAVAVALRDEMKKMYWEGVEEEIAAAIIAFSDFQTFQPSHTQGEELRSEDMESDKMNSLIDLWNPMGELEADFVKSHAMHDLNASLQGQTLDRRRARSLLQALGLLDIDYVREHRPPVFRSWGQMPQIDHADNSILLRAVQCSQCRRCIRSFHSYICRSGCKDSPSARNMYKVRVPKPGEEDDINFAESLHDYFAAPALQPTAFRLCPPCLQMSDHPKEHLKAVRNFSKAGDKHATDFAKELDAWEDYLDGKFLTGLGAGVMDSLASPGSIFRKATSRHVFPAGNAHCAVMVGPLLIENGMTRKPGGANISRRPIPNLTADSSKDLQEFLFEPQTYISVAEQEVPTQRHLALSSAKRLYEAKVPVRNRRFAGFRKQLSGGMFTGYCERFLADETNVVDMFLSSAQTWDLIKNDRRLNQSEYRAKLKSCAKVLTKAIAYIYGEEVDLVLFLFAFGLVERVKLSYNRLSNNCQDFCSDLLFRHDADNTFGLAYPSVPPNVEQIGGRLSARYLMSFCSRMIYLHEDMPFVNPLASTTQLYDSFGQNDADMIDHVASIRFKSDPTGFHLGLGGAGSCHDEYLLKAADTTCFRRTRCSMLDHILDGPQDNLSVLTTHIHRDRNLYTAASEDEWRYEDFLVAMGPEVWVRNRLETVHRLFILNTALAVVSSRFQEFTAGMTVEQVRKIWNPPPTMLSRAWYSNKRSGRSIAKPTWHDDIFQPSEGGWSENDRDAARVQLVLMITFTNPWMQSDGAWKVRLRSIKATLSLDSKRPSVFSKHWVQCRCAFCHRVAAGVNCSRFLSYAASQEDVEPGERVYLSTHPDYVSLGMLEDSIKVLGDEDVVLAVLSQLSCTPEYYGMDRTRKLLEPFGYASEVR